MCHQAAFLWCAPTPTLPFLIWGFASIHPHGPMSKLPVVLLFKLFHLKWNHHPCPGLMVNQIPGNSHGDAMYRETISSSLQRETKGPGHTLQRTVSLPWESSVCSWGMRPRRTEGISPFNGVPQKHSSKACSLWKALGSPSQTPLLSLGMLLLEKKPTASSQGFTFSLHESSPALSEIPQGTAHSPRDSQNFPSFH